MREARQQGIESAAQKRKKTGPERGSDLDRKFWTAIALFAILAALVWFTMGEGSVLVYGKPVQLRLIPLIVIGGLALRTVLARQAEKIRRKGGS
jgi:hypothetical protein